MRIAASLMAVMLFLSSTMWAAGPAFVGTLRTTGSVLANSAPMPDGGTVRSGDSIETHSRALALITSPQTSHATGPAHTSSKSFQTSPIGVRSRLPTEASP